MLCNNMIRRTAEVTNRTSPANEKCAGGVDGGDDWAVNGQDMAEGSDVSGSERRYLENRKVIMNLSQEGEKDIKI